jgi:hypothetical protein
MQRDARDPSLRLKTSFGQDDAERGAGLPNVGKLL